MNILIFFLALLWMMPKGMLFLGRVFQNNLNGFVLIIILRQDIT